MSNETLDISSPETPLIVIYDWMWSVDNAKEGDMFESMMSNEVTTDQARKWSQVLRSPCVSWPKEG